MNLNNGLKFFAVILVIAVFAYIAWFGEIFGMSIPGAKDIRLGIDINGGIDTTLYAYKKDGSKPTEGELDIAKTIINKRLDNLNILDRDVTSDSDSGSILVRMPWKQDEKDFNPQKAINELGKMALLSFQEVDENLLDENGDPKPTGKIIIEGTEVVDAKPQPSSRGGMEVQLDLTSDAKKKFADATGRLVGQRIAIFMDDIFISAPKVQNHIVDGNAVITLGNLDMETAVEEAKDLADTIKSGSLPFKLEPKQINSISPKLGKGALKTMTEAGAVAFALVCLFMVLYYRVPGVIACFTLVAQTVGQLLAISWPHLTLTLPGIAGIVLSIGMGVDANIIVGERIKEELKSGKTLRAAIDAGFDRAFSAVFDGNLTVLIAAIVLYIFGTGPILSFAYSLGTGVILNFVTGIVAPKIMIKSVSKIGAADKHWLYGA